MSAAFHHCITITQHKTLPKKHITGVGNQAKTRSPNLFFFTQKKRRKSSDKTKATGLSTLSIHERKLAFYFTREEAEGHDRYLEAGIIEVYSFVDFQHAPAFGEGQRLVSSLTT